MPCIRWEADLDSRTKKKRATQPIPTGDWSALPLLLTSDEVAALLRTTRTALWASVARGQIPGVRRVGRRMLFNRDELVAWLSSEKRDSTPEGKRR